MQRFVPVLVAAGLIALARLTMKEQESPTVPAFPGASVAQAKEPEKPKTDPVAGTWTFQIQKATGVLLTHTLKFADGKVVYTQPRDPGLDKPQFPVRIEGEYAVTKSGRVYGVVTRASGETNADEGDTFSFVPMVKDGQMAIGEPKGVIHPAESSCHPNVQVDNVPGLELLSGH